MRTEIPKQVIDLFPQIESEPMREIIHEERTELNGITIRLLRCRDNNRSTSKVTTARNEICASYYDDKKTKYRDFIRMVVAETLPEAMPKFLQMSIKEIGRLLPRYAKTKKVDDLECKTVKSFDAFAEALQRRPKQPVKEKD